MDGEGAEHVGGHGFAERPGLFLGEQLAGQKGRRLATELPERAWVEAGDNEALGGAVGGEHGGDGADEVRGLAGAFDLELDVHERLGAEGLEDLAPALQCLDMINSKLSGLSVLLLLSACDDGSRPLAESGDIDLITTVDISGPDAFVHVRLENTSAVYWGGCQLILGSDIRAQVNGRDMEVVHRGSWEDGKCVRPKFKFSLGTDRPDSLVIVVEDDTRSLTAITEDFFVKRQLILVAPESGVIEGEGEVRIRWVPESDQLPETLRMSAVGDQPASFQGVWQRDGVAFVRTIKAPDTTMNVAVGVANKQNTIFSQPFSAGIKSCNGPVNCSTRLYEVYDYPQPSPLVPEPVELRLLP